MKTILVLVDDALEIRHLSEILSVHEGVNIVTHVYKISDSIKTILQKYCPDIVINIHQDITLFHTIIEHCCNQKIHYIDCSEAREHVVHIVQWDAQAKSNNAVIVGGAGIFPGISMAIVEEYAKKFKRLIEIDLGISFSKCLGDDTRKLGEILAHRGTLFERLEQGKWQYVRSGSGGKKHYYGDNMGLRWQISADIPDLTLLPLRYSGLHSVTFHQGVDSIFLPWVASTKIFRNSTWLPNVISTLDRWCTRSPVNTTGMYVHFYGTDDQYQPLDISWTWITEEGDGKFLSLLGATVLVGKILRNEIMPGAYYCVGLFSLEDLEKIIAHMQWKIYTLIEEKRD